MTSDEHQSASKQPYIRVAIPGPLRQTFQYLACAGIDHCAPGSRVLVPFRNRKTVAFFLESSAQSDIDPDKLLPAIKVVDPDPVMPQTMINLCLWATNYYHHGPGDVFVTAVPKLIRGTSPTHQQRPILYAKPGVDVALVPKGAKKQRALLEVLIATPDGLDKLALAGFTKPVINGLVERGFATWHDTTLKPFDPALVTEQSTLTLNARQQEALAAINANKPYLLLGVTGSGKTEVYLRKITEVLQQGKQALVLVPEIGLTPQTVRRFTERFSVPIVTLHSAMTDAARLAAWQQARAGHAAIIIGTRSAVFTPMLSPGLIVVDEEHDLSYKQHDGFRYSARDLAVMRGNLEHVPVILGSATPAIETLQNAAGGKYQQLTLPERTGESIPETYHLVSTRHQPNTRGIAEPIVAAIRDEITAGNQALIFINRRGYAPVLYCGECGWIAGCRRCDNKLTVHRADARLACHHCGSESRPPVQCPDCNSTDLMPLGHGTQRLEEDLAQRFPDTLTLRIDRDTTRRKDAMHEFTRQIESGEPAILIGTQLISKGHHFPNVTLVVMLDMDSGFFSSDFRAMERTAQLMLQVGGRSGRAEKPGRVLIQTAIDNDPRLQRLIQGGYLPFADTIMAERRQYSLPPFTYHALFRAEASRQEEAANFLHQLTAPDASGNVDILGPVAPVMERRAGLVRSQLLLSSISRQALHQTITQKVALAEKLGRKVRWSIDVDPYDLT